MSAVLQEGMVFGGRYRVVRCIAAGGMGAVYEVIHLGTNRHRAMKVMHPHLFQNDEMRERFIREAQVTSKIESEHIVDVSDAGIDGETSMPFLVMELLHGEDLGERLKRVGQFSPAEAMTYLAQTASALDRTHRAAIVHRDLKPANLFLTQRDDGTPRIKILDFGVAKVVAESATAAGTTRSLGTPLYMSPEQFRAGAKLTSAADIYALGMMAYSLLVGETYWNAEVKLAAGEVIAFALLVARGPVEPAVQRARARGITLPQAFDGWFIRATAFNPSDRFATATEAVRALGQALGGAADSGLDVPVPSSMNTLAPAPLGRGSAASLGLANSAQMQTPAGAAVTASSRRGSRQAWTAAIAVLAIAALGAGGVLALKRRSENTSASTPEAVQATSVPAGTGSSPDLVHAASASPEILEPTPPTTPATAAPATSPAWRSNGRLSGTAAPAPSSGTAPRSNGPLKPKTNILDQPD